MIPHFNINMMKISGTGGFTINYSGDNELDSRLLQCNMKVAPWLEKDTLAN